jgi:cephalosporin hydroxylase
MSKRIKMLEGSSIDEAVVKQVHELAKGKKRILVILDSNHTHDHVLAELKAYAPLVTLGSYCLVFDTIVEDLPVGTYANRSWDIGNNPKTAVWEYLKENDNFVVDNALEDKLLVTVAPNGYLKRVK